jgi:putative flippase GtrA
VLAALLATGLLAPVPASCAGYAVAAVLNYGLRRRLVFRSREAHRRTVPRYLAVLGAGFGLNAAVMALGVDLLGLPVAPVQVAATGLVLIWNFTAHRLWTFRASPPPPPPSPAHLSPSARGQDAWSETGLPTRPR